MVEENFTPRESTQIKDFNHFYAINPAGVQPHLKSGHFRTFLRKFIIYQDISGQIKTFEKIQDISGQIKTVATMPYQHQAERWYPTPGRTD